MAITEYYVRADADGAGNGTTDANSGANGSFTWAQVVTRMSGGAAAAGDRYNIKSGSYSGLSTATFTNDGTTASPIIVRGFNVTPGDLDTQGRTGGNGALDLTNFPVLSFNSGARLNASGSDNLIFQNINVTVASTGFSGAVLNLGLNGVAFRCYADNISTNAAAAGIGLNGTCATAIDCDAALTGASGGNAAIALAGASVRAVGCRVIQSQNIGIGNNAVTTMGHVVVAHCVVANCGGDGISFQTTVVGSVPTVLGNTVHNCTGNGISIGDAAFTGAGLYLNNHVTNCGANGGFYSGRDATAQLAGFFAFNRTRDNATAAINGFDDWAAASSVGHVTNDTGGEETDFTNAGANNFSLVAAAPAKGVGLPLYTDIGALQRQESASGGLAGGGRLTGGLQ